MKAPFPFFGGKVTVAKIIWRALGQPAHYIEPFFGSGAVLLNRPRWNHSMVETVNDKDSFIANVWRSIQFSPDETAKWCDWPVNHADLMARKAELVKNEKMLLENLIKDPKWHDPVLAGYWIWAASCWIGSGLTLPGQIPHLSDKGMGVHKSSGQIPHLGSKGMGVHATRNAAIYEWFNALSHRLRNVRVVCGEWNRVCGGDWQGNLGSVGMYFDPPYGDKNRDGTLYHQDSYNIAKDVETWVLERGSRKDYRIVVSGYDTEYGALLAAGWKCKEWKTGGGYGKTARNKKVTKGQENRFREVLFFSPYCLFDGGPVMEKII